MRPGAAVGRTVVLVDIGGNAIQGGELPSAWVLPMRVGSDAQFTDLSVTGSEIQAGCSVQTIWNT